MSGAVTASFLYDGDGKRVKSSIDGTTTYFVGNIYEQTGATVTKYYYLGGERVAMRQGSSLYYLLSDHLGSTTVTTDVNGAVVAELHYKPWGEVRSGAALTSYTFTGQYSNTSDFGLMFYNARWYDPALGRFTSADTIVPDGVQGYDRYAYVNNSPVNFTDPSGHDRDCGLGDSVCNESRREYREWREYSSTGFDTFMRARDAYHYYSSHPDSAFSDMFQSSGPGADNYTLANIYSQNVRHEYFEPLSLDYITSRLERARSGDPVTDWRLVALQGGAFGTLWFSQEGDVGGGLSMGAGRTYDLLMPNGQPIGIRHPSTNDGQIRTVIGESTVRNLYDGLTVGGTPHVPARYPGAGYHLVGGGWAGLRVSEDFGLTIDVSIPGIPITKIHWTFPR